MRIKLVGGAYKEPYLRFNNQRCINWYPHYLTQRELTDPENQQSYLKPVPGLKAYASVTGDRVRGVYSHNDNFFFVVKNVLYTLKGDTALTLGTMSNFPVDSEKVYMRVNGNDQLGIFGGTEIAYVYDLSTETLSEITDIDFPGAETMEYLDGYGIVVWEGRVYFSELNDFTDWRGDSVYTPTDEADKTINVVKLKGILWNFGQKTIEPYYNDATTPFKRVPNLSLDVGLYARHTVGKFTNELIFVGYSNRGSINIYMIDRERKISPISPGSISEQLNSNRDALKSAYVVTEESHDNHMFYHLCIPDMGTTFTYDLITFEWHERQSLNPVKTYKGQNEIGHWRITSLDVYKGKYLVGDYYTGSLLEIDPKTLTDVGNRIRRERTVGVYSKEQKYISVTQLILNASYGLTDVASPKFMVCYSVDGGYVFKQERHINLPALGDYGAHLKIRNLGTGRNWVVKFILTDQVDLALFTVDAHGSMGVV